MTSNVNERLKKLFDFLKSDFTYAGEHESELNAYIAGINLVLDSIEKIACEINLHSAENYGLSLFCEMAGISGDLSIEEKRNRISERFGQKYGSYKFYDLTYAVEDMSNQLTISKSYFDFTFSSGDFSNVFDLKIFSNIFNELIPPCTYVRFPSNGASFDKWDSTNYYFQDYDNLKLPFSVLDQLK